MTAFNGAPNGPEFPIDFDALRRDLIRSTTFDIAPDDPILEVIVLNAKFLERLVPVLAHRAADAAAERAQLELSKSLDGFEERFAALVNEACQVLVQNQLKTHAHILTQAENALHVAKALRRKRSPLTLARSSARGVCLLIGPLALLVGILLLKFS